MRIVFVRHGHPDYARDCLTELGHAHAAAAAERLRGEGIGRIFSSTCGRALETAGHLAELLAIPVERCDFMREIQWGPTGAEAIPHGGHPWALADSMIASGESLMDPAWEQRSGFGNNRLIPCVQQLAEATDAWLVSLGYTREGAYYRVTGEPCGTVAVFGHGGASAAMLSHLFNLPFPFVCSAMGPNYTGITIITLADQAGQLVMPRFELLNDARHIQGLDAENVYGR